MQTLDLSEHESHAPSEEMVPALNDTLYYFAFCDISGRKVLAILDGGQWRPCSYQELMELAQ